MHDLSRPGFARGLVRCLVVLVPLLVTGCRKPSGDQAPKPWPSRPTKVWSETAGGVKFQVTLPEGLGVFRDPNARIFRVDNLGLGPMVAVARAPVPKTLEEAMESTIREDMDSFGKGEPRPDGFLVRVRNSKTGMLKFYRWLRKGRQSLRCCASFFWRDEKPRDVSGHNALLERICLSITITG